MEERTILWIFYAGILMVVFLSLATFMRTNLIDDEAYKAKFLSKDIALLHDSLLLSHEGTKVDINFKDEKKITLDKRTNCRVVVENEKTNCGKGSIEKSESYVVIKDNMNLEIKDKEVVLSEGV